MIESTRKDLNYISIDIQTKLALNDLMKDNVEFYESLSNWFFGFGMVLFIIGLSFWIYQQNRLDAILENEYLKIPKKAREGTSKKH